MRLKISSNFSNLSFIYLIKNLKIFSSTLIFILSDGLSRFSKFLLLPFYINYLTPEIIGTLFLFESIVVLVEPFFSLGLQYSVSRFYNDFTDTIESKKFIKNVLVLKFLLGGIILLLFLFFVKICLVVTNVFDISFSIISIALFCSFMGSFSNFVQHKSIACQTPKTYSFFNLIYFILSFSTTIIIIIFLNGGIQEIILGILFYTIVIFLYSLYLTLDKEIIRWSFVKVVIQNLQSDETIKILKFSFPFILHNFAILCLVFFDRIILSFYVSKSDIGVYSVGYQVASIIPIFAVAFKNSFTASFYKIGNSFLLASRFLNKIFFVGFIFSILILIVFFLINEYIEQNFKQNILKYTDSITIFKFVIPGMIFCFFYTISEPILIYSKKTFELSIIIALSAILNATLNILFIPNYGIFAASISTDISYLFMLIGTLVLMKRYYGYPSINYKK